MTKGVTDSGHMVVRLRVGVSSRLRESAKKANHETAPDAEIDALVDTGCSTLEISQSVLDRLGIQPHDRRRTMTAGGEIDKWVYSVDAAVLDAGGVTLCEVTNTNARNLPPLVGFNCQALVGWTLLQRVGLRVDGPSRLFEITAR